MIKKILAILMAAFVIVGTIIAVSADTIGDLQDEKDRLEQEAQEAQNKVNEAQGDIDDKQEDIDKIVEQIAVVNGEISEIQASIESYKADILEKEDSIAELTEKAEESMDVFRARLCAIYKAGDVSALEIILGASDFNDFVDKVQLLESMNEKDAKLLDEISAQMDTINKEVESLNSDKDLLEVEEAELADKQADLSDILAEHEKELAVLYGVQEDAQNTLDSIEASQAENEKKIQDYYDSLKEDEGGTSSGGSGSGTVVTPPQGGGWVWPTPAHYYITSYYCEDRGSYYHGGLDIAGVNFMGCNVVAACSGTVIDSYNYCAHNWGKYGSCGCNGGWGNYVWIDHGNGKATIYAHLSSAIVYPGQSVSAGQLIGYGGTTGYSTGPHLHFECRYYGTKYDPLTEFPYM